MGRRGYLWVGGLPPGPATPWDDILGPPPGLVEARIVTGDDGVEIVRPVFLDPVRGDLFSAAGGRVTAPDDWDPDRFWQYSLHIRGDVIAYPLSSVTLSGAGAPVLAVTNPTLLDRLATVTEVGVKTPDSGAVEHYMSLAGFARWYRDRGEHPGQIPFGEISLPAHRSPDHLARATVRYVGTGERAVAGDCADACDLADDGGAAARRMEDMAARRAAGELLVDPKIAVADYPRTWIDAYLSGDCDAIAALGCWPIEDLGGVSEREIGGRMDDLYRDYVAVAREAAGYAEKRRCPSP